MEKWRFSCAFIALQLSLASYRWICMDDLNKNESIISSILVLDTKSAQKKGKGVNLPESNDFKP